MSLILIPIIKPFKIQEETFDLSVFAPSFGLGFNEGLVLLSWVNIGLINNKYRSVFDLHINPREVFANNAK